MANTQRVPVATGTETSTNGPPRWYPPPSAENFNGLKVSNSLCNDTTKRVPFVPSEGRKVTWYTCGPTVYDSSHVGHARTYLSFDIIRRILEDYFGYEILYVMNVTDVDDKIINRARQNYLLDEYLGSHKDPEQVLSDVELAIRNGAAKQSAKVEATRKSAAESTVSYQKAELETQIAQEELKLKQLLQSQEDLKSMAAVPESQAPEDRIQGILGVGKDALASWLDSKGGSAVTDLQIFKKHAAQYEEEFFSDLDALGVRRPDVLTRVTEYIPEIIAYVEGILNNGAAYVANGSVYFDTNAFIRDGHRYGKLNPGAVGSVALAAESEANFETTEKRDHKDFALWKAAKPGEPSWSSPWGEGRPGWHIECSAMASNIIGQSIDIHSGGFDLKFPHHDNEMAQAEAFHKCHQWVRYFLHTGHLHIEGLKMSKSLKNFITIQQALEKYSARQIRFLFVLQAWDKPMNFGESAMAEALAKEKAFKLFFQNVQVALRKGSTRGDEFWEAEEKKLSSDVLQAQADVGARLEDNFDTSGALAAMSTLVTAVNVYITVKEASGKRPRVPLIRKAAVYITKILKVFGLIQDSVDMIGFGPSGTSPSGTTESTLAPILDSLLGFRDEVRNAARKGAPKDVVLGLCDKVRDDTLVDLGIRVEDNGLTSVWKLDDKETLVKERNEKLKKAAEDAFKKAENKRAKLVKEREKLNKDCVDPREMFNVETSNKYSKIDSDGMPTHDREGKELSKVAKKNAEKEFKKQSDAFEKFKKRLEVEPGFRMDLDLEIQRLEDEIVLLKQKLDIQVPI